MSQKGLADAKPFLHPLDTIYDFVIILRALAEIA